MEFVPAALFFTVFFGMALFQAWRKNWRRAFSALLTSFIGPLALGIVLLHQRDVLKKQTQQLEQQIQTQPVSPLHP
jgi:hypothetical protein